MGGVDRNDHSDSVIVCLYSMSHIMGGVDRNDYSDSIIVCLCEDVDLCIHLTRVHHDKVHFVSFITF